MIRARVLSIVVLVLLYNQMRAESVGIEPVRKKALITGITGQDGRLLAEFLLNKGYEVHGIKRRSSSFNTSRIDDLYTDPHVKGASFFLHYGDLTDAANMARLLLEINPDEVYNLAAQSHVKVSFELPLYTGHTDALGVLALLEGIRMAGLTHKTKFYQASSSEMFGLVQEIPQKETTPFYPRSPYGVAKLYGYWITKNYRESYGMFAVNGILFNHESFYRGETFVTKKIVQAAVRISLGKQTALYLGNLDAQRDWGYAPDYVEAMWLMMQHERADDFVIATGQAHSVREFVELAFAQVGIAIAWRGSGVDEVGYDANTGKELIFIDSRYFRPAEVDFLLGDASKAAAVLGWQPKTTFKELVTKMMQDELNAANSSRRW